MSVAMSQAAAPGLVEPCPLCEMKMAASWCSIVDEPSGLTTKREVASANAMPETKFPTRPSPKLSVLMIDRLSRWSTVSPAAPPASTVPLPCMPEICELPLALGEPIAKRCSIIGVGSPSMVVIGSSQSSLVVFHSPMPP